MPSIDFQQLHRAVRGFIFAGLMTGVLWMSTGCKKSDAAAPAQTGGPPPALITAADVVTRDVPVYLDQIGKCSAFKMVAIKPQVNGKVVKIPFADGEEVKAGRVLFEIDPAPYKAMLAQATAQLSQSNAQLGFAQVDFNRIKDLPRSVEPQSDYDAKQNAIDVANAMVEAAKAAIEVAQVNVKYCTIDSPIDGLTGQRSVDEGNVVIANNPMGPSASLLTIQQMDPIYADFTVTENDLAAVRKNMALGTLKTQVRLPSDSDARDGKLSFLDNAIQEGAGIIKLRALLPNKDRHFWPGQFVFVRLVLQVQKDALLVPTSAVQVGQQGSFVYIVKPDSSAELRPVVLGQVQGDLVVIQKGISSGERVVATGQMMVAPGGKVRELPPTTLPAATTTAPAAAGKEGHE